jgi:hypothetical protein
LSTIEVITSIKKENNITDADSKTTTDDLKINYPFICFMYHLNTNFNVQINSETLHEYKTCNDALESLRNILELLIDCYGVTKYEMAISINNFTKAHHIDKFVVDISKNCDYEGLSECNKIFITNFYQWIAKCLENYNSK